LSYALDFNSYAMGFNNIQNSSLTSPVPHAVTHAVLMLLIFWDAEQQIPHPVSEAYVPAAQAVQEVAATPAVLYVPTAQSMQVDCIAVFVNLPARISVSKLIQLSKIYT
jgi:hypothetical protein